MKPFEWLYWRAIDLKDEQMAEGVLWLLRDLRFQRQEAEWQASRRFETMK
jgi:hypothetical protein